MLVVVGGVSSAVGPRTATDFALGGTESQRAQDVLERDFPSQAGDADQVVFHARRGHVTDPAVRARIAPVLAKIARLPHVATVRSLLLPAVLELLGRRTWAFPGGLGRRLPRVATEPEPKPTEAA